MAKKKTPKITREMILSANDIQRETVPVPEWGEDAEVTVTTWSAKTRDEFDIIVRDQIAQGNQDKSIRCLYVCLSVIDEETGERLFELDDLEAMEKKNQAPINRIFQAVTRLNPVSDQSITVAAKN
jgi:hypothetical protein